MSAQHEGWGWRATNLFSLSVVLERQRHRAWTWIPPCWPPLHPRANLGPGQMKAQESESQSPILWHHLSGVTLDRKILSSLLLLSLLGGGEGTCPTERTNWILFLKNPGTTEKIHEEMVASVLPTELGLLGLNREAEEFATWALALGHHASLQLGWPHKYSGHKSTEQLSHGKDQTKEGFTLHN